MERFFALDSCCIRFLFLRPGEKGFGSDVHGVRGVGLVIGSKMMIPSAWRGDWIFGRVVSSKYTRRAILLLRQDLNRPTDLL